jgi:hypothetical protein
LQKVLPLYTAAQTTLGFLSRYSANLSPIIYKIQQFFFFIDIIWIGLINQNIDSKEDLNSSSIFKGHLTRLIMGAAMISTLFYLAKPRINIMEVFKRLPAAVNAPKSTLISYNQPLMFKVIATCRVVLLLSTDRLYRFLKGAEYIPLERSNKKFQKGFEALPIGRDYFKILAYVSQVCGILELASRSWIEISHFISQSIERRFPSSNNLWGYVYNAGKRADGTVTMNFQVHRACFKDKSTLESVLGPIYHRVQNALVASTWSLMEEIRSKRIFYKYVLKDHPIAPCKHGLIPQLMHTRLKFKVL